MNPLARSGPSRAFVRACAIVFFVTGLCGAFAPPARAVVVDPAAVPRIGTWNVNLHPGDTADDIVAAIPKHFLVLAVQGLYLRQHDDQSTPEVDSVDEFLAAVKRFYPYSYVVPPQQSYDIGCATTTPQPVCQSVGYNIPNCVPFIARELLGCLIGNDYELDKLTLDDVLESPCAYNYLSSLLYIDNQCPACLLSEAFEKGNDANAILEACLAQPQQGARYAYGGTVSQLVLSKLRLNDTETVEFPSYFERRVNIYATIGGVRYGFADYPSDILASNYLAYYPYPPLPGALQDVLAQQMLDATPDVILGSFNSGPDFEPAAYDLLSTEYQDLAPGLETYCTQAMIDAAEPKCILDTVVGPIPRESLAVDHVFFRFGEASCRRGDDTADLFNNVAGLSDHAGLKACGWRLP